MKFIVNYNNKQIEIEQLENGKFKKPNFIKKLSGSFGGMQVKPSREIIIVAMKPLSEKTYVEQAMKNGKGITWLDDGRISTNENINVHDAPSGTFAGGEQGRGSNLNYRDTNQGRFPANLLVSDDVLNDGKSYKTGDIKPHLDKSSTKAFGIQGKFIYNSSKGDSGSFSRYFDLDKWWEEKIKQLTPEVQKVFPFLIVPKASKSEKNKGCEMQIDNSDKYNGKFPNSKADRDYMNKHPTVKPIKLFSYLITLGSRENDIVLDPFIGSGTAGISAILLNRKFIGIEISQSYCAIANKRILEAYDKKRQQELEL